MATLTIADLDNGKRDLETVEGVANSRAPSVQTRYGQQTTTLYEAIRRIVAKGDQQLAEQQASAEAIIRNLGYLVPVPYASGLSVTEANFTVVGPDGNIYAAQAGQLPFTTGAWNPEQWYPVQNDLNDRKLLIFVSLAEAEAAAAVLPDGQAVMVLDGSGLQIVTGGALTPTPELDFSHSYAAGTVGAYLQEAATNVRSFPWLAKVDGVTDDGAKIQAAMDAKSAAGGGDVFIPGISVSTITLVIPSNVTLRSIGRGYNKIPTGGILFRGNGAKSFSIPDASAVTVPNPDAGAPYLADSGTRGDVYSTIDFSVGFSAAVIMEHHSSMRDMAVIPWFDGVSGYRGTDGRMSDPWDVGIWARNASGWRLDNVMSDGHWRKAGFLVTSSDLGDGKVPENELGEAQFCLFGGARAVSIRTPRNTPATNYGFAGTDFINCYMRSFDHQSAHLATSSFLAEPQPTPSACIELDGRQALRGIQFLNCTIVGRDDVSVMTAAVNEVHFTGCYEESRSLKINGAWVPNTLGSRMVATAQSVGVFWQLNSKYAVDFSPYFGRDSSLNGQRYPSAAGAFNAASARDSDYERPNFKASYGTRLIPGQAWRLYDSNFNSVFSITESGGVNLRNVGVTAPSAAEGNLFSGTYTPAAVGVVNVEAVTPSACQYMRVGNVVTVSGQINIDPTALGEVQVGLPLPIASNFGLQTQCAGTSQCDSPTLIQSGAIKADTTNERATLRFVASSALNATHMFQFTYVVR